VLLLTVYWVSEAVPYAVTSLFPLFLFPMAGIIPGDQVGLNYFKVRKSSFFCALGDGSFHARLSLGYYNDVRWQHDAGSCCGTCSFASTIGIARTKICWFIDQMV
jgi:hypothetical protein